MNTESAQMKFVPVGKYRQAYDHLLRVVRDYSACVGSTEQRGWVQIALRVLQDVLETDCKRASAEDREWHRTAVEQAHNLIEKVMARLSAEDKHQSEAETRKNEGLGEGINTEVINGTTYYSAERRGVLYTAYHSEATNTWQCLTHRKALGRSNPGGCRHYETVALLAQKEPVFFGLDRLIGKAF